METTEPTDDTAVGPGFAVTHVASSANMWLLNGLMSKYEPNQENGSLKPDLRVLPALVTLARREFAPEHGNFLLQLY